MAGNYMKQALKQQAYPLSKVKNIILACKKDEFMMSLEIWLACFSHPFMFRFSAWTLVMTATASEVLAVSTDDCSSSVREWPIWPWKVAIS